MKYIRLVEIFPEKGLYSLITQYWLSCKEVDCDLCQLRFACLTSNKNVEIIDSPIMKKMKEYEWAELLGGNSNYMRKMKAKFNELRKL